MSDPAGTWADLMSQATEDEYRDQAVTDLPPVCPLPSLTGGTREGVVATPSPHQLEQERADYVLTLATDIKKHTEQILVLLEEARSESHSLTCGWGFENARDLFGIALARVFVAAYDNRGEAQRG